ncbi:MAG: FG-GAP repeat domain-containing protein [Minwuia sp.]|uniref:FG-GAP repeat domain-containing protein n=1 Tax=Minwuia sp. TaxID=2493630 RepID=UPI003A88FBCC
MIWSGARRWRSTASAKAGCSWSPATTGSACPNRWLNPAGIADFDGDGVLEIAVVVTPHIGGTLRLLRPAGGTRMTRVAEAHGFSNHAIGSRDQDLSAVLDWDGDGLPDLALPDAARREVVVVGFPGGIIRELARFPLTAAVDGNFTMASGRIRVPLAGGGGAEFGPDR